MSTPRSFSRWRPHPWHGLEVGPEPPGLVHVYLETGPFDLVKYEIDKESGYLRVDRPHRSSSQIPALYGFIPRTYCGERVRALMAGARRGDGDPLDVCVVSERPIARAEVLVTARVIGGLPMLDNGEADDKIIAILEKDPIWSQAEDLHDLPSALLERLRHYFETYKLSPDDPTPVSIGPEYDAQHAETVIRAAMDDYQEAFGEAE
jgi:inorganic pyrophosphatase